MKVKIKKLEPNAVIPSYAKPGDAGMDLTAISIQKTDKYTQYKTGLAFEIPEGYVGLIFPRSSNSDFDQVMSNCVAVIDSAYRGEILIRFKTLSNIITSYSTTGSMLKTYEVGDRVAQIIILPYPQIEFEESNELSETDRGFGGFGHTGN